MSKPEWGAKRRCLSCAAAFYDLKKDPITCPKCGTVHHPEQLFKSKRGRPEEKPVQPQAKIKKPVAAPAVGDIDIVGEDLEDDEDLIEDASELGEDDDDVAEVLEGGEDEEPVEGR